MTMTNPIVHHPFVFHLRLGSFGWEFTGFGIAVFLAFLIAQIVTERELRRRGFEREAAATGDVLLGAIAGTLVGAKLYYVGVLTHDWHDLFTRGGFVYWGGFTGAVAACAIVIRLKGLPFARYADVGGIAIAAGYSVGRSGCWAVGDDYGKWYQGPLSVAFPEGAPPSTVAMMAREFHARFPADMDASTVVSVVPTQLIEVVLGFLMFLILWRLRRHTHAEGWLFGAYCVLAGSERFLVEFLRIKDDRFFGTFSLAQMIAAGIVVAGLIIMSARRTPPPIATGVGAEPAAPVLAGSGAASA